MIRFTVIWHELAQDSLARIWLAAPDRAAVTDATHQIDRELGVDASFKGKLVAGNIREITVLPLRALFEVSEADRMVRVAGAKRIVP